MEGTVGIGSVGQPPTKPQSYPLPLGRILGTTRRWLISGRFFTYKFGAHPRNWPIPNHSEIRFA